MSVKLMEVHAQASTTTHEISKISTIGVVVGTPTSIRSSIQSERAHHYVTIGIGRYFLRLQTEELGTLKLFKYLQAARATGQYEKKFQALVKVPLLIIDDFGLKPLRTLQDEALHDLIAERYEKASTMVTSNLF